MQLDMNPTETNSKEDFTNVMMILSHSGVPPTTQDDCS